MKPSDPEIAGIVVTHGTATLEETAYFLGLAVRVAVPVVVVGAMRPSSALGSEGGLNLFNAVRVAASPQARGLGTLVVMNDEIHAARDVTKTANYRVNTFVTRDSAFWVMRTVTASSSIAGRFGRRRPKRLSMSPR